MYIISYVPQNKTLSITLFVTCLYREFSIKNIYASQMKQKKYPERCWIFWYLPLNGFCLFVCLMVFNATFNNISVILWRSVLLVEETGENHWPVASHWQTLSHNVVHLALIKMQTHNISGDRYWLHR